MNTHGYIVLMILLAILTACNGDKQVPEPAVPEASRSIEGPTKELSVIDSLLWRQPDSALAVLQDYLACRDAMLASPDTVDSNLRRIQCVSTTVEGHYANL